VKKRALCIAWGDGIYEAASLQTRLKEHRYTHLLCGDVQLGAEAAPAVVSRGGARVAGCQ